jgi:hypothetical protein
MKAELINTFGDDNMVVDCARVSLDKTAEQYTEEQNAKPPLSKSDWAIMYAVESGYTANKNGDIFTAEGKMLSKSSQKRSGHLSITLLDPSGTKKIQPVLAHRFIAYYFYGVNALLAECVRHLNDIPNDNRVCNLAYGTKKENRADIPKERLSIIGKAKAPMLVERSRKLSDEDIRDLRNTRENTGVSYAKLAKTFKVSTMTAYRACVGQSWGDVV